MHESSYNRHESLKCSIKCLAGGTHSATKGQDFAPHRHPCWEFVYYRSGHIKAPVGSAVHRTQPGMLLITPPDTLHAEIADTAYSNYYVCVDAPRESAWPKVVYDDPSLGLQSIFAAITHELNANRSDSDVLLGGYSALLDLLLQRAGHAIDASPGERLVSRAESIIEERFRTPLKLYDISSELNCSSSGLRAHFKRLRRTTPRDYLRAMRLQHALGFIHSSDLTFDSIAQICGYDSASHLSRHVRSATGMSPGSVRRGAS
jgi:AraC-like DNA-binding protein